MGPFVPALQSKAVSVWIPLQKLVLLAGVRAFSFKARVTAIRRGGSNHSVLTAEDKESH